MKAEKRFEQWMRSTGTAKSYSDAFKAGWAARDAEIERVAAELSNLSLAEMNTVSGTVEDDYYHEGQAFAFRAASKALHALLPAQPKEPTNGHE